MKKDVYAETRKRELYEMLEKIAGESYVDQESLVELVGLYPLVEKRSFHDSTARRILSQDIQEINEDPEFSRIIISSAGTKGVKLASPDEAREYINRQKFPCFQKLKRLARLEDKLSLHGQMDLEGKEYRVFLNNNENREGAGQ